MFNDYDYYLNTRKHLFHIVDPSPWPVLMGLGAFLLVTSLAFYMHNNAFGFYFLIINLLFLLKISFFWLKDICTEATFYGYHTIVVKKGLKMGFLLFIASEAMLFLGFFWAFLHSSLSPSIELGCYWPPKGINIIYVFDYPLLNTIILIVSGFSVTWAHRSMSLGSTSGVIDSLLITIILGIIFIALQTYEYYEADFNISDSVYSSSFFMLTGLHGLHVIIGVIFLSVCLLRVILNHFTVNHYLGLIFAIWYWHFVDVVWICLFFIVYVWGSW